MNGKRSKTNNRKNKKGSTNKNSNVNNEIKGIITITIGILIFLSMISSVLSISSPGSVGEFIKKILLAIMGLGSFVFPFIIIFVGICNIVQKGKIRFNSKFHGINLFIFNTMLFVQMINLNEFFEINQFIDGFIKIYNSNSLLHGGIISYVIAVPMYKLFGNIGSYVIFISIYVISLIMIFKISLYKIFSDIIKNIKSVSSNNKEKKVANKKQIKNINDDPGELLIACDDEKDGFIKNINKKIKVIDFMKSSNIEKTEIPKNDIITQDNKTFDVKNYGDTANESSSDMQINNDTNADDKKKAKNLSKHDADKISEELENEIINNSQNIEEHYEYKFPTLDLLNENNKLKSKKGDKRELLNNAEKLQNTLQSFGVKAKVVQVTKGPSVTRFEIQPEPGVKVSKIVNLSDDIALNLASSGVRIEAPIPGKAAVGIEIPNKEVIPVFLREVIESNEFKNTNKNLAFCLGKDIAGNCVIGDLSKMPHTLVAGATGSGKSVCINTLIISLLFKYSPDDVKLLLIDPKVVELSVYNGIPHLLIPVVTDPKKSAGALNWAVNEMTRRYKAFADNGVRNIEGYNELVSKGIIEKKMPSIVIIIDELADLMMVSPKDVEDYIARLAQMARAAGMHLVIATQRPSVDVITGMIKANIPSRISFSVSSQIDSRTILDCSGAEKLLGKGDMLYYPIGASKPLRIQGAFISEPEVEKVVDFIKNQKNEVEYASDIIEEINNNVQEGTSEKSDVDPILSEAIEFVIKSNQASTSMLQRKFKIGYNRAARIIDEMEERNIISERNGSKPRQILVAKDEI